MFKAFIAAIKDFFQKIFFVSGSTFLFSLALAFAACIMCGLMSIISDVFEHVIFGTNYITLSSNFPFNRIEINEKSSDITLLCTVFGSFFSAVLSFSIVSAIFTFFDALKKRRS